MVKTALDKQRCAAQYPQYTFYDGAYWEAT